MRKGSRMSPESRALMSAAAKGRSKSEEHRRRISESLSGRRLSVSHKVAVRRARALQDPRSLARFFSPETLEKMRQSAQARWERAERGKQLKLRFGWRTSGFRGWIHSVGAREKMSEAQTGRSHSEETRRRKGAGNSR